MKTYEIVYSDLQAAKEIYKQAHEKFKAEKEIFKSAAATYKLATEEFADWCAEAKKAKQVPSAVRRALKLGANAGLGWGKAAQILGLDCKSQSTYNKLTAGIEDLTSMDLPEEIRPLRRDFAPQQDKVIEWLQNIAAARNRNSA